MSFSASLRGRIILVWNLLLYLQKEHASFMTAIHSNVFPPKVFIRCSHRCICAPGGSTVVFFCTEIQYCIKDEAPVSKCLRSNKCGGLLLGKGVIAGSYLLWSDTSGLDTQSPMVAAVCEFDQYCLLVRSKAGSIWCALRLMCISLTQACEEKQGIYFIFDK